MWHKDQGCQTLQQGGFQSLSIPLAMLEPQPLPASCQKTANIPAVITTWYDYGQLTAPSLFVGCGGIKQRCTVGLVSDVGAQLLGAYEIDADCSHVAGRVGTVNTSSFKDKAYLPGT